MLLRDYTRPELEHLIMNCNFTEDELVYFQLKAKDCSNVKISLEMNISETNQNGVQNPLAVRD